MNHRKGTGIQKWMAVMLLLAAAAKSSTVEASEDDWTLERKVAQLFFVTPDQLSEVEGTNIVGDKTKEEYAQCPVGGIIFMEENLQSQEQVQQMTQAYQELSEEITGVPMFIGTDEEGGKVARIANSGIMDVPIFPPMYEIGQTGNCENAYTAGKEIGEYLKTLGLTVDFAPVADIWNGDEQQSIGERSFGSDAELTSEMVASAIRGFHDSGIKTTVKHFPGHGDTAEDSHNGLAYDYHTKEDMKNSEWKPFVAGIDEDTEFVMAGHICCPKITGDEIPASLSHVMLTEILREELGYEGLIITDAMNMKAVTEYAPAGEAAVLAMEAGADMILMPDNLKEAYQAVLQAVRDGRISEERIEESLHRIVKEKKVLYTGERHL